ncbi:hypothetical protein [Limnospira platensis]|uniref:hypothetical protein n=1 Tax=Limnospira platensis TaxID=118562 RepID=UPI0001D0F147|nr:hypothetical protein [Arthrospira platensis NCB002]MDT9182599.1 hypothetical protein [Limnospira sp. PMC 289.06]QQW30363.1 hypothetical protein AP9108_06475 [Arthrospira sp. PCC 9108]BAI89221.1 hypothetical protein NIES39_C03540 [Arthrospira platensis NIES-39]
MAASGSGKFFSAICRVFSAAENHRTKEVMRSGGSQNREMLPKIQFYVTRYYVANLVSNGAQRGNEIIDGQSPKGKP